MNDSSYMTMAVQQAALGKGHTWTNPCVGAVIVKNDQILATGYHHRFGEAHAEVDAFANLPADDVAVGATMYVTLEPCSHYGKTPPCANAIVAHGIKRVVIGNVDPNPVVSSKGIEILKAGGVEVSVLNIGFTLNAEYARLYQRQRPTVTLKYAMSLDGKINGETSQRTRVTGQPAYEDSQRVRAAHQAILVGEGTLRVDDPQLTVRTQSMAFPPIRIAVVRDVNALSKDLRLFQGSGQVWLLSETEAINQLPDNVAVFVAADWPPAAISQLLYQHQIATLLVEGGSRLQAAFVKADLVDRLVVYLAPTILGGAGLPSISGMPTGSLTNFEPLKLTTLGADLKLETERRDDTCLQES